MSVQLKLKKKNKPITPDISESEDDEKKSLRIDTKKDRTETKIKDECLIDAMNKLYTKKCGVTNKKILESEESNWEDLKDKPLDSNAFLYPSLDDPNFNVKIASKKEFSDTKYDGSIYDVEAYSNVLKTAEYELLPQQAFVRNFLSFQTPYNSLLLYHGLGSGKTCSAIGVCEEMRDYLKQMGINKRIIIVASPNVQDNFKLQLFDERKLKEVDGIWTTKGCLGNKLLKEINPTGMKGLSREKVVQLVNNLIRTSYSFKGYVQFSNEIVRNSGNASDPLEYKIKNLENEYSDRLVVIDEVHNIRISDDNENKNVAKNLMFLVSVVSNLRLLLLSATPMFNSYKEIVWLINLMNMNDRRGMISVSDIFSSDGSWKKGKRGEEIGKDLLMRKATGYVSYVRGENPYTFPFRVYPDRFAIDNTFKSIEEYPKYQLNGKKIPDDKKISKLSLFITKIGDYQQLGYDYIMRRLRTRGEKQITTRTGAKRTKSSFKSMKSFGYTDLQIPIEALNIIYPYDGLKQLVDSLPELEYDDEVDEENEDFSLVSSDSIKEKEITEEIDDVLSSGPKVQREHEIRSELESEPYMTEGVEATIEPNSSKELRKKEIDKKEETGEEEIIIVPKKRRVKKTGTPNVGRKSKTDISFKGSLKPNIKAQSTNANAVNANAVTHIAEGEGKKIKESEKIKGGERSEEHSLEKQVLYIDSKELTGAQGLKRIMNYVDTKTPAEKGKFEYKRGSPKIFQPNEIGKYSAKIKNICESIYNSETKEVSDGIILIYSAYIDAGIIPMALALEEMGFTRYVTGSDKKTLFNNPPTLPVDVRTMKPPTDKKDFKPARYVMITGDSRISPNNDGAVKAITSNNNLFRTDKNGNIIDTSGEVIKVVLISQAGSEGLDFKGIRQVHILEPWYNMNRIEQIIGRAVRNFSHKDLPFSQRNVQIFLYGTILENSDEEAVDLYVYRMAEIKAVKIGKVTRLLKQTSVDCIINHDQTELIASNFDKIKENQNIVQTLSDHQKLEKFQIGDIDDSATCDYMTCEFKCLSGTKTEYSKLENIESNTDTYNETFMLINSDKLIQKIKGLMKLRHFYKRNELLDLINTPKKYPTEQIYSALTQIINDNSEFIVDKYDRTGYLVNIGEYYMFQPSEINYKNISIYERSVPIDYKHNAINFVIKSELSRPVIDKRNIEKSIDEIDDIETNAIVGKKIFDDMFNNYMSVFNTTSVNRGDDDWYHLCGVVIRKMMNEDYLFKDKTPQERLEIFEEFLIEHIVDSLMIDEKIHMLNYIYLDLNMENKLTNEKIKRFYIKSKKYLLSRIIVSNGIKAIVMFNGPSRKDNLRIYILNDSEWVPVDEENRLSLQSAIKNTYKLIDPKNLAEYVGFIGFETNNKFMVYKVKDTKNKRSTGFRCDQATKQKLKSVFESIIDDDEYFDKIMKETSQELRVRQEFILRGYQKNKFKNKVWFLDTETAIINEFEKKEKS